MVHGVGVRCQFSDSDQLPVSVSPHNWSVVMAANWPVHQFLQLTNKPVLYIEGRKLRWNKTVTKDGVITMYLYCVSRLAHCKVSATAVWLEDDVGNGGRWALRTYKGTHLDTCVPNSALTAVHQV